MEGEDQAPRVDVGKNIHIYPNNNFDTDLVTDRVEAWVAFASTTTWFAQQERWMDTRYCFIKE